MTDPEPVLNPVGCEVKKKRDGREHARQIVDLLLPDSLMIALALVLLPLILIPLLIDLPDTVNDFINFIDYLILAVFIIEYVAKTVLAPISSGIS